MQDPRVEREQPLDVLLRLQPQRTPSVPAHPACLPLRFVLTCAPTPPPLLSPPRTVSVVEAAPTTTGSYPMNPCRRSLNVRGFSSAATLRTEGAPPPVILLLLEVPEAEAESALEAEGLAGSGRRAQPWEGVEPGAVV